MRLRFESKPMSAGDSTFCTTGWNVPPGVPRNTVESALVVVLPPGNYTAIVTAAAGTGVALLEVNDLRTLPVSTVTN